MATITLRNVPEALYQRLKADAARNRRSLNQEVIAQLERAVFKNDLLARIDAVRDGARARGTALTLAEMDSFIKDGQR